MNRFLCIICILMLLPAAVSLAEEAKPDAIGSEEYAVYAAVFAYGKLDGIPDSYVVVEARTVQEEIGGESWKDVDPSLIRDFNLKNKDAHQLEERFPEVRAKPGHPSLRIKVRMDRDSRSGPFDTGRTYVSRVGFSRDGKAALVYVQHVATPESGIGHYVFLEKTSNNGWVVSGSIVGRIF